MRHSQQLRRIGTAVPAVVGEEHEESVGPRPRLTLDGSGYIGQTVVHNLGEGARGGVSTSEGEGARVGVGVKG